MKVKIFDCEDETDLEESVNNFLEGISIITNLNIVINKAK